MIIHDLEFLNCCSQEYQKSDDNVIGGASASSAVKIDTSDGEKTFAMASVKTEGDDSYSIAVIGDKVIKTRGKKYGNYSRGYYSGSYKTGYGGVSYSFAID